VSPFSTLAVTVPIRCQQPHVATTICCRAHHHSACLPDTPEQAIRPKGARWCVAAAAQATPNRLEPLPHPACNFPPLVFTTPSPKDSESACCCCYCCYCCCSPSTRAPCERVCAPSCLHHDNGIPLWPAPPPSSHTPLPSPPLPLSQVSPRPCGSPREYLTLAVPLPPASNTTTDEGLAALLPARWRGR